jgi:ATP-dependent Clp protease adapter protein ClpS
VNVAGILVLDQYELAEFVYDVLNLTFPDKRDQAEMALS